MAIDENEEVWGWGKNHFGMLGTGDTLSFSVPRKLNLPKGICQIGGGCFQSLAIDKNGKIWTMGDNPSGQQGQGHNTRLYRPAKIKFEMKVPENSKIEKPVNKSSVVFDWTVKLLKYSLLFGSICLNIYFFRKLKPNTVN